MYIYFISFGCKVNLYETEYMKQTFEAAGFGIASEESEADGFVVNSCTVTGTGDKKVRQTLHRLRREYPDAVIALTGCLPQAFEEESRQLPADIITGTKERGRLHEHFAAFAAEGRRIVDVSAYTQTDGFESMKSSGYEKKTRAFVKIQDGCNQFCSYCIIPYARGRVRSKPLAELEAEVNELAENGYWEFVLTGINLCFYGGGEGMSLADAVEVCCKTDGIERVRLGSLEPEKISDEDIARMSSQEKLCPQFHLSLQSGCDRTLRAMNRRYTSAEYAELVEKLRLAFHDCAVTTDVMVGFPGETEEDFAESVEFARKIGFARVHVFPYSPRNGTKAAQMSGQVSAKVKAERAAVMAVEMRRSADDFLHKMVGKEFPILFERENEPNYYHGYTPNYTLVRIHRENDKKSLRNRIFCVKIIGVDNDGCIGEICHEAEA